MLNMCQQFPLLLPVARICLNHQDKPLVKLPKLSDYIMSRIRLRHHAAGAGDDQRKKINDCVPHWENKIDVIGGWKLVFRQCQMDCVMLANSFVSLWKRNVCAYLFLGGASISFPLTSLFSHSVHCAICHVSVELSVLRTNFFRVKPLPFF